MEVLATPSHRGVHVTTRELSARSCPWLSSQTRQKCGRGRGEREPRARWCGHCGEQHGGASDTHRQNHRVSQQPHFSAFFQRKTKLSRKISAPHVHCSIVHSGQGTGTTCDLRVR